MAIIDSKGRLHGKVANYVYRTLGNTSIIQSKPGKVKQTIFTRESALEFGLASNSARIIRSAFFPLMYTADKRAINRLNVAVMQCIKNSEGKARGERDLHDGDLSYLEGFQFNSNSPLTEALLVRPVAQLGADNRVKVTIPAIRKNGDLLGPKNGHGCTMRLMLVVINFRENYYEYIDYKDFTIGTGKDIPAQEWQAEQVLPAGSIALLSVSLHYHGARGMLAQPVSLNTVDFSPAEMLAAFKIPAEDMEETDQTARETGEKEVKRFSLSGYYGKDILMEMRKQREKWEKKQGKKLTDKVVMVKGNSMEFPKGKVFFKKE